MNESQSKQKNLSKINLKGFYSCNTNTKQQGNGTTNRSTICLAHLAQGHPPAAFSRVYYCTLNFIWLLI